MGHVWSEQERCRDGGFALASGRGARRELCEAAKVLKESLLRGLSSGSVSPPGERRVADRFAWLLFALFSVAGLMAKCLEKFGLVVCLCFRKLWHLCSGKLRSLR